MGGLILRLGHDTSDFAHKIKPGTAKRALAFIAPYVWQLALLVLIVVAAASIGIVNPLIYRKLINSGILKGNPSLVVHLAFLAGALSVIEVGLGLAQSYLSATIAARIVLQLRTKLFEHIQRMPIAFFVRTQTGALVTRLNNDVNAAGTAFTDILANLVGNMIIVVLVLGALFTLSWRIALLAIVLPSLLILPSRLWVKKLQGITRESYDVTASLNSFMIERFNVAGAYLAKLFCRPENEIRAFEVNAARVSDIGVKGSVYTRVFLSVLISITAIATSTGYGWGGVLAVKHMLDIGTIVALVSYLGRLYMPLIGLSNIQFGVLTVLVSFERVFEVLDLEPMMQERPNAVSAPRGSTAISFDRVSFRYPSVSDVSLGSLESVAAPNKITERTVLRDLTFTVEPGQVVALIGPSGSGKTTITHLVARLYDVESGSIKLNGIDVRDIKLDSLRQRIGVVTQHTHVFHDTIRANMLYAKTDATDAEILAALKSAHILSVVISLPDGLDTLVGEKGYRFSGGEKQRLAIARLFLKKPDIVILDEATTHLDSACEAAVQRSLDNFMAGRTSIVVAHRLATVQNADQILVLRDGRIVERGTHAALLKSGGVYSELYQCEVGSL
jgi:ATP-binding cassette subfamily B protein